MVELIEIGLAFAAKDDGFRGESVLQAVPAGDSLAGFGPGTGGGGAVWHIYPVAIKTRSGSGLFG